MPTFIGQPVEVVLLGELPEPVQFVWQGRTIDVREVTHRWTDWNFGEGSHRRSWRNRRHRNYYRVRTDEGEFELYVDRGVQGESRRWILVQRLDPHA